MPVSLFMHHAKLYPHNNIMHLIIRPLSVFLSCTLERSGSLGMRLHHLVEYEYVLVVGTEFDS